MAFDISHYYDRGDYYELKYPQGSEEWLKNRPEITGSTVAYKTGMSPIPSWPSKSKEEEEKNFALGHEGEKILKEWFAKKYNKKIQEMSLCRPKWNTNIGVSVDGLYTEDKETSIIECKTTKRLYYPLKEKGEIYTSHYYQMLLGMEILNANKCHYLIYAYEEGKFYHYIVKRDKDDWKKLYDKILY
jgi:hypothetical protein